VQILGPEVLAHARLIVFSLLAPRRRPADAPRASSGAGADKIVSANGPCRLQRRDRRGRAAQARSSYLLHRNKTRFEPLIHLRDDFNAELQQSADNL